ncbi:MAG: glycosyltransferase [Bacteroidota bacterium]
MKILVVGSGAGNSLESSYINSLQSLGIDVSRYISGQEINRKLSASFLHKAKFRLSPKQYYDPENKAVLEHCSNIKPDIILIFKGMEFYPDTIQELKSYCRVLANYNPDHPLDGYSRGAWNTNVYESIPFFDIHFSYAQNISKRLKKEKQVTAYTIPFGFNANLVDLSKKSAEFAPYYIFIGMADKPRASFFSKVAVDNFSIYGNKKWISYFGYYKGIRKAFKGKGFYSSQYFVVHRSAKGSINYLREQNFVEGSHNMRTFEVPGCGGVLISQRTEEQLSFFEEDKEAVYFSSSEELNDKLRFYNDHPSALEKIRENGIRRSSESGYSYVSRAKSMINHLKDHL